MFNTFGTLTDEDIRNNPSLMYQINSQMENLRAVGYEDDSLVEQLNMAINFENA